MADADRSREDEKLLRRAEAAFTEIKVAHGLAEPHADVLAALRIRLKGDPGKSLEDLLAAAEDEVDPGQGFDDVVAKAESKSKGSLDDLFARPEKPKPSLDDLFGPKQ